MPGDLSHGFHNSFNLVRDRDAVPYSTRFSDVAFQIPALLCINSYYGGLHCGECFDVFVRGKWKPTRIEYGDNWYLVGIRAEDLNGLRVRI